MIFDPRSREAVDSLAERVVIFARRAPIGENQQIAARNPDPRAHRLAALQFIHQLRNAINQDVLVIDCRKALHARHDLKPVAIMLVTPDAGFRFLRQGIEGMFLALAVDCAGTKKILARLA